MKKMLAALAANPMTYVLGFATGGAASIVAGVAILMNAGMALIVSGVFLISAASYITKGLKPNG